MSNGTATTNVPSPTFTATGFVLPAGSAVLEGVQDDFQTAFGGNLNFGTTTGSITNPTPQGQLSSSLSAIIENVQQTFQFYTTQTDPAYAEGRMQDAIGRIYFLERNPAIPTTLQVTCTGAANVPIPAGSIVIDPAEILYISTVSGTIGVSGQVNIQFVQQQTGALPFVPSEVPQTLTIYQAIPGWDTATVLVGQQGTPVESRTAFENRRKLATAANSIGSIPSILGAVLQVPGVFGAYVTDNSTTSTVPIGGGQSLLPNSLYVAAIGGSSTAIATAIWTRKPPGTPMNGNTTVQVTDTSTGYVPPFPTYNITFEIPTPLPIIFNVDIVSNPFLPSNSTQQIQQAIVNQGAALNIGSQGIGGIGALIQSSSYIPTIAALGNWAQGQIISVNIGSQNDPDAAAAFAGMNGTTMIVTAMVQGTLSVGQYITDASGLILPGTTILSQVNGTMGGGGTYFISQAQNVINELMGFSTPDQTQVQVNINQYPTFSVNNIVVNYET